MRRIIIMMFVVLYLSGSTRAQDESDRSCPCLESSIRFDISSIEKIYLHPEEILADPENFWQSDEAYRLTQLWHEQVYLQPDKNKWIKEIEKISNISQAERENHPEYISAMKLAEIEKRFVDKAVPHLCEFLPDETDLSTTLYFTTKIMAAGFQRDGKIVINIINQDLLNLFVHEIYHIGFSNIYKKYVTEEMERDPVKLIHLMIQIEGMATYAAYKGLEEFPETGDKERSLIALDYELLSDQDEIKRLHSELIQLYRDVADLDSNAVRSRSWELGNNKRAYYVVGAFMAGTIDEKSGREVLVESIKQGPGAFFDAYNTVADDKIKINLPY
ncbi:MAG: hypothetical protein JSW64_06485 [Candidatus Zixiibacteriota bacterium]|nr:MAG: hypothetical protein JSW64_06485 [candidate division Zixibacteria bacterium]